MKWADICGGLEARTPHERGEGLDRFCHFRGQATCLRLRLRRHDSSWETEAYPRCQPGQVLLFVSEAWLGEDGTVHVRGDVFTPADDGVIFSAVREGRYSFAFADGGRGWAATPDGLLSNEDVPRNVLERLGYSTAGTN